MKGLHATPAASLQGLLEGKPICYTFFPLPFEIVASSGNNANALQLSHNVFIMGELHCYKLLHNITCAIRLIPRAFKDVRRARNLCLDARIFMHTVIRTGIRKCKKLFTY